MPAVEGCPLKGAGCHAVLCAAAAGRAAAACKVSCAVPLCRPTCPLRRAGSGGNPAPPSLPAPAAPAWSWRVVHHRDSPALASLKLATAAALEELVPHSPRDLRLSPSALGKLKSAIRLRSGDQPLRR